MKKFLFVIFCLIMILSFSYTFAASNVVISPQKVMVNNEYKNFEVYNIDGNNFFKLRDIAYVLNATASQFSVDYNSEKHLIEVKKNKSYTQVGGELVVGADKSKTAVPSSQKLSINNEEKSLTAYNIGGNNFFKLRELGTALDFNVDFNKDTNSVIIESKKEEVVSISSVIAKIFNGTMYVEVTTDKALNTYNLFTLSEPERIIFDVPNSKNLVDSKEILVKYAGLQTVRLGDQGGNVNRIVLDLEEKEDYKVVQSEDKKITCIALTKTFAYSDLISSPEKVLLVYNGDIIKIPGTDDKPQEDNSGETNTSGEIDDEPENDLPTEEELANRNKITSIKYTSSTNKLKITGDKTIKYEASKLTSPHRIVIDIENAVLEVEGPTSITPNNKNISEIRFSQKDDLTVRVVFELKKEGDYSLAEKGKIIEVSIKDIAGGDMEYDADSEIATFTLYGVKKSIFSTSESSRNNTYTLKFSTSKFNPKLEDIEPDDNFVETIEVKSGKIIINGTGDTEFSIQQINDYVVVTMKNTKKTNDSSDGDFVVLLDAGHGGSGKPGDPGACNGTAYEKDYNLKMMLKLKELLDNTDGIKTYASRTTDVFIDRQGRLDFATGYENANIYVSIHNNSSKEKRYSGTLVMFHDGDYDKDYGITSKELAQIVSDELVDELGTRNWGIRDPKDQVWVLYYSTLPSIMCEVAYMSNDEELERIKSEEFQEAAARAIYNGILKAKEQIEKNK